MTLRTNTAGVTGTFSGITVGSAVAGNTVSMGSSEKKVESLSAIVIALADTSTFTITPQWQVSLDGTNWAPILQPNAAANVAIATGTTATDSAVIRIIDAPRGVEGWPFARMALVAGVTGGTTGDTYSIAYTYRAANY